MTRRDVAEVLSATLAAACLGTASCAEPDLASWSEAAVPINPIEAVVDAFLSHDLVALSEGMHTNEQSHAFRMALLQNPGFVAVVNDIVLESGNARYQPVMDRFIRGEDVPMDSVRHAWRNTTQAHAIWDVPIYEQFFRQVREVNRSLPPDRRLRVLLGDPPIDWEAVRTDEDVEPFYSQRDSFPAALIEREVLAKGRRALIVYGGGHLVRRNPIVNYQPCDASTILGLGGCSLVELLEAAPSQPRVFSVWTFIDETAGDIQRVIAEWPRPSLALLAGTTLGMTDFRAFFPFEFDRVELPMEQQFDAVLYLGPPSQLTYSRVGRDLCADSTYMAMRLSRMQLRGHEDPETLISRCRDLMSSAR